MKGTDKVILLVLPLVALVAGFWFLGISPKRDQIAELDTEIKNTAAAVAANEELVAQAEAARADFPKNYSELVALGSAVPEDDDQATLVYEMAQLAGRNDARFRDFEVVPGTGPAPAVEETPTPTANAADESEARVDEAMTGSDPAVAAESVVSTLPIGASVGPAGLPVTPYNFKFLGNFFKMADLFEDIDDRVSTAKGRPVVEGRLMTINGFSFEGNPRKGFPSLEANLSLTTFIVPPEQGLAAGATPAGPDPAGVPGVEAAPVSTASEPAP